jgi:hypothetical protein
MKRLGNQKILKEMKPKMMTKKNQTFNGAEQMKVKRKMAQTETGGKLSQGDDSGKEWGKMLSNLQCF